MPWQPSDAHKHKKGLTKKQAQQWAKIANSVLEQCRKDKGKNCEAKAIKAANSKVGNNKNSEEVNGVKKKMIKVPKGGFQFFSEESSISFKDVDEEGKPKSFSMEAYTGAIMPDVFGGSVAVDVSGIDFDGKKRFPILEDHEWANKIGVSNSRPNMENNRVSFDNIKVLNNEKAQEFAQNLADGFPYQASISIRPRKIEEVPEGESADVNGTKMKGPGIILRSSTFREASVCVFGRDTKTGVKSLSDSDYDEMEVEAFSQEATDKKQKKSKPISNGGKSMLDLTAIKDEHPDLVKQINAALKEKDDSITSLTTERDDLKKQVADLTKERDDLKKEKEDLSASNTESEKRIVALEAAEQKRKEKDLKNSADAIVVQKLSASTLPERLHKRIKKQLDHNDFVDENDVFDVEKFKEHVDTEINSWIEDLKDTSTSESILGLSGGGETDDFSSDSDKLSDHMVSLAGGVDNSQKSE